MSYGEVARELKISKSAAGKYVSLRERLNQLHVGVTAASGELGEHGGKCNKIELKVQELLPTQKPTEIATTRKLK